MLKKGSTFNRLQKRMSKGAETKRDASYFILRATRENLVMSNRFGLAQLVKNGATNAEISSFLNACGKARPPVEDVERIVRLNKPKLKK